LFVILGYTNELFEQHLRTNGWKKFLEKVTLFFNKHGVEALAMEGNYVLYGR